MTIACEFVELECRCIATEILVIIDENVYYNILLFWIIKTKPRANKFLRSRA